jgi:hypothetical protein
MPRKTIKQLKIYMCLRCGYEWVPRIAEEPKRCAGCKSMYWNKEVEIPEASKKAFAQWKRVRKTNKESPEKIKKSPP